MKKEYKCIEISLYNAPDVITTSSPETEFVPFPAPTPVELYEIA